jgi:hypothetical protein
MARGGEAYAKSVPFFPAAEKPSPNDQTTGSTSEASEGYTGKLQSKNAKFAT